jgi:hypothetical protein
MRMNNDHLELTESGNAYFPGDDLPDCRVPKGHHECGDG